MKKYIFLILNIAVWIVVCTPLISHAMDPDGCLTCHQYPGLATHEKDGPVKILHIDEEAYLASPHGGVKCRKCHTTIKSVPHTGERRFNCATGCHIKDRKKIEAVDLSTYPIHKGEKFAVTSLICGSCCRFCHTLYPHSADNHVRAFVNMHAGFILCEVCHLKKEKWKDLTYDWGYQEYVRFSEYPYGNYQKHEQEPAPEIKSQLSEILKDLPREEHLPCNIEKTEYSIKRIAAFFVEDGEKRLLLDTWDSQKAADFMEREEDMSAEEKKKELDYFHRDTAKKEISAACDECHAPKAGLLDYEKLGFDKTKINKLRKLNIKGLITKYDTFYFPELLHPK